MSGSTIIIERHSWRGFKTVGGELGTARTCGWFTFTYCPFLLSKWIEERITKLKEALRKSPGHVVRQKSRE